VYEKLLMTSKTWKVSAIIMVYKLQRFAPKSIIWFSGFGFLLLDVFINTVIKHL